MKFSQLALTVLAVASFAFVIASDGKAEHQHLRTIKDVEGEGRLLGPAGETKYVVPFGCVASFDADRSHCFNTDAWCREYLDGYAWADTSVETGDGISESAEAYAQSAFMSYTFCEVAKQARSTAKAMYHARGTFEVTRHGNNGAVFDINLKSNVETATMVAAVAKTDVKAVANSSLVGDAYIYTDLSALCGSLRDGDTLFYWWLCVDINHVALASDIVQATTFSSAFSRARAEAGSKATEVTSVYVEGSNLQKFIATIVVGASNFAIANSKSLVNVYAQAFTAVFEEAYVNICRQRKPVVCNFACRGNSICNEDCTAWDCDSSYANASASVGVVAEAYGEAYAKSFARASVSFAANAYFTRTNGKNPNKENGGDIIKVSGLGSGFAKAGAVTSCD